jgi:hypothetical protein
MQKTPFCMKNGHFCSHFCVSAEALSRKMVIFAIWRLGGFQSCSFSAHFRLHFRSPFRPFLAILAVKWQKGEQK